MNDTSEIQEWESEIKAEDSLFSINFKEVWQYRDLLLMLVKRDYISTYKQTILGPIWFFVQQILTMVIYVILFGQIAKLSTDGTPQIVFYLSGITIWNYFSESLTKTSSVFRDNAAIFGKDCECLERLRLQDPTGNRRVDEHDPMVQRTRVILRDDKRHSDGLQPMGNPQPT